MKTSIAIVLSLVTACACSKAKEPAPAPSAGSGSGAAAIVVPPYAIPAGTPEPIRAALTATDRADRDRALDAGRKPAETFTFFKLAPGQKVGELFSGPGYSTEVIARIVGADGKVWAQNTTDILDRFARKPLMERLAKPVMKNTVFVEQPTETPFPPDAKDLDAVICILNYHDYVWQKVDRTKLNAAVFAALKPGGVYGVIDHSAAAGSGTRDVETFHRIDEDVVKQEILAAGFKLDGEAEFLRNPADTRDWNDSPKAAAERRGTSDRFVLRFVKP